MATYSEVRDLLTGDLTIGSTVNRDKFVQDATDEINSRVGFVYELPLNPAPATHIALTLKRCANLIASGRLILALGAGGEDLSLHAYGESLLREGQSILHAIESGQIDLGCDKLAVHSEGNAPTILQGDSSSGAQRETPVISGNSLPLM